MIWIVYVRLCLSLHIIVQQQGDELVNIRRTSSVVLEANLSHEWAETV
jgi:hypothetical protein